MIENRLNVSKNLLAHNGIFSSSIDDDQDNQLISLLDNAFNRSNLLGHLVWDRNHSAQAGFYKIYHEYVASYAANKDILNIKIQGTGEIDAGAMKKPSNRHKLQSFKFPKGTQFDAPHGTELKNRWGGAEFVELVSGKMISENGKLKEDVELRAAWTQLNQMKGFFDGKEVFDTKGQLVKSFYFTSSGKLKYKKERLFEIPSSVLRFGTASQATIALTNILGFEPDHTPKPLELMKFLVSYYAGQDGNVLDYFAGSGTTAHAVIELNRDNQANRKYILVEQGEYFDTVLKPRIQKVIYSADWKEGKPTNPESGISHCLKVVKLESYEDTLNNLELVRKGAQQTLLAEQQASTKPEDQNAYSDYLMHYMLELESKDSLLNVKDFLKPFSYQMNITTDSAGAFERKIIDLVETFNYLIGLNIQEADYQLDKGYVQITGKLRTGEYTTVLWRDCDKIGYAELDQLLSKLKINPNDGEYQLIYINGDHNVASKYTTKEGEEKQLKVRSIEQTFLKNMFEE